MIGWGGLFNVLLIKFLNDIKKPYVVRYKILGSASEI